ncbi:N-acetylmuramoyl-L-alanine amidase [Propionibacteriaceae bacterium Y2011]
MRAQSAPRHPSQAPVKHLPRTRAVPATLHSVFGVRVPVLAAIASMVLTMALVALPARQADAAPSTATSTLKVKSNKTPRKLPGSEKTVQQRRTTGPVRDTVLAEATAAETDDFSTLGVTWRGGEGTAPEVQIRTKGEKEWTAWETITDGEPLEGRDGRLATDPVYVGESTGVEVRVLGDRTTKASEVELTMINSEPVAADANPQTEFSTTASTDLYPRPPVITRAGWGANESWRCTDIDIDDTIKGVVVHHTAGSNSYSRSQSASIVRDVYSYHARTLGWCDIGYNFLIDKYGQIFEGRAGGMDVPVHGAHATSWNTDTMGVSFMGNYETALPPAVMLEAGAKIIAWKLDAFQREAKGNVTLAGKTVPIIFRHGDVMQTACPGRHITSRMGALRDNVAAKMGGHSPIHANWLSRGGEGGWLGSPSVAERAVGSGRVAGFQGAHLYWRGGSTHAVGGAIGNRYRRIGHTGAIVGWPTSDEINGLASNSRQNTFTSGRIVWRYGVGAHEISGDFNKLYSTLGPWVNNVGVPVTGEYRSAAIDGVMKQAYSGGRMYWSPSNGAYVVFGAIFARYGTMGEEGSFAGMPISNEYAMGEGRASNFEGAIIAWTPSTGAHDVRGGILRVWRELGTGTGVMGFPTTGEFNGPIAGSRITKFTKGQIIYSHQYSAQPVRQAMSTSYDALGNYRANLGAPMAPQYTSRVRSDITKQDFSYGKMYQSAKGTYAVFGGIGVKYAELGEESSRLGAPTSAEHDISGGRATDFEHGRISWNRSTGKVTVSYR